jgi:hypothetical protein
MPHIINIEGIINVVQNDKIIVHMYNNKSVKNIIATYGEVDFVPFINDTQVKIKYGSFGTLCKKTARVPSYEIRKYEGKNCIFTAKIRKNRINGGTSISILLMEISLHENNPQTTEEYLATINVTQSLA